MAYSVILEFTAYIYKYETKQGKQEKKDEL